METANMKCRIWLPYGKKAKLASYFGRILQRLGVKSRRKTYGTYYHVVPLEVK